MTDGFLNDLDLGDTNADPNYIADSKYRAFVYQSEVRTKKDDTRAWVITYKIAPDQKHAGQTQQEWFDLLPKDSTAPNAELKRSFLKKRILSLGVPESKIGQVNPNDLIGTEVSLTIKHKDGYQNVGNVDLAEGGSSTQTITTADVADLL